MIGGDSGGFQNSVALLLTQLGHMLSQQGGEGRFRPGLVLRQLPQSRQEPGRQIERFQPGLGFGVEPEGQGVSVGESLQYGQAILLGVVT